VGGGGWWWGIAGCGSALVIIKHSISIEYIDILAVLVLATNPCHTYNIKCSKPNVSPYK